MAQLWPVLRPDDVPEPDGHEPEEQVSAEPVPKKRGRPKGPPKAKPEPKPPKAKAKAVTIPKPPPAEAEFPTRKIRDPIFTKVRGVTSKNDHDGSDRQEIIRRYCRKGMPLYLDTEPDNPRDPNAIAIWIRARRYLFFKVPMKIGYIGKDLAPDVLKFQAEGMRFGAWIAEVTGGGELNHGVNLEIKFF